MADHSTPHDSSHPSNLAKSQTAFRSSFWFVLILAGLFIAALNFVEIMGHSEEGHGKQEPSTEMKSESSAPNTGEHAMEPKTPAAHDSTAPAAAHEEHH